MKTILSEELKNYAPKDHTHMEIGGGRIDYSNNYSKICADKSKAVIKYPSFDHETQNIAHVVVSYPDSVSGFNVRFSLSFNVGVSNFMNRGASFVQLNHYNWKNISTGYETGKLVISDTIWCVHELPTPTATSFYVFSYSVKSRIAFCDAIKKDYPHLFYDTDGFTINVDGSGTNPVAELVLCGISYSGTIDEGSYDNYVITTKEIATVDQIPTNSHDADKVISPTGTTVVRSLDNGTATITAPGASGELGAPVVTFSSDFDYADMPGYAGRSIATKGPFTLDNWTVYVPVSASDPSSTNDIFTYEFIIAAPSASLIMFFSNGSDIGSVSNFDTSSPTVSLYSYGSTISGSATMVRNYAPVTKTLATLDDIQEALGTVASALDAINGEVL